LLFLKAFRTTTIVELSTTSIPPPGCTSDLLYGGSYQVGDLFKVDFDTA
jgi:hypothetical protein